MRDCSFLLLWDLSSTAPRVEEESNVFMVAPSPAFAVVLHAHA